MIFCQKLIAYIDVWCFGSFTIAKNKHEMCKDTVALRLERPRTFKLVRFLLIVLIEGTHYTRSYGLRAQYYKNIVEGGRMIQGVILIEESALHEVERYDLICIH